MARKQPVPRDPKLEPRQAMDSALILLKFRRRSEDEISRRLALKGFSPDAVKATVERLKELGLLDDEALARDWLAGRRQGGQGDIRIRQKLRERGLRKDTIDLAFAADTPEGRRESEEHRAWEALRRRAGRVQGLDRQTAYRRLGGYLVRQGFSYDAVQSALKRHFSGDPTENDFQEP